MAGISSSQHPGIPGQLLADPSASSTPPQVQTVLQPGLGGLQGRLLKACQGDWDLCMAVSYFAFQDIVGFRTHGVQEGCLIPDGVSLVARTGPRIEPYPLNPDSADRSAVAYDIRLTPLPVQS